ncbi:hypothetical protein TSMG0089 [Halocynthia phage JM-2012]|uniref:hypothetical protein n=1 Tax=Halocynthia phage JM-2012 TaxID=1173297 RepID=UPI00025C692D|nr:hypothetical protein TSMG0089 [Halocynthia phage JM-2012]AFI55372.1 hypothetical protein TSMG0089 [Halocynthia phage JM-2012]
MKEKINNFPKIGEFRKVVKYVTERAQFKGLDSSNKPIFDRSVELPVISYIGTVKMHGTNGRIVLSEDGTISFHSKESLLGYITPSGIWNLVKDNYDFAYTLHQRLPGVIKILNEAKELLGSRLTYPITLSGEWVGSGIAKGSSLSNLPNRSFVIFNVRSGLTESLLSYVLPIKYLTRLLSKEYHIYNVTQFKLFQFDIDFNNPLTIQNKLVECVSSIEEKCPVADFFNLPGELVGEGIVCIPDNRGYIWEPKTWFKVKGKKHSSTKVKTLAAICPEKLNTVNKFIEYSVTVNRLEQALGEIGLAKESTGSFIKWIIDDIRLEENDTLEQNNLTIRDVSKGISKVASNFYLTNLNNK